MIEDNPGDARLSREMLRDTGSQNATIDLSVADRLAAGLERLQDEKSISCCST